ncbi:MAG: hypothetical protein JNL45_14690 [Hyphomicrobium sp.]|jgi:hypothetical protein|nr:hypothetical protein [Hyphomicrobium sp.]
MWFKSRAVHGDVPVLYDGAGYSWPPSSPRIVADRTLARLNYPTFIGNNPSIRAAARRALA